MIHLFQANGFATLYVKVRSVFLTCSVPVKVAVLGQIPASLLEVPKSEILTTPLYVFTRTLSPFMSLQRSLCSFESSLDL